MKNSMYKRDRQQLSNSDFSKHKDFNSTLKKVKTSHSLSLTKKISWGAIGVAGIASAIILSLSNPSETLEDQTNSPLLSQTETEPPIMSPLEDYETDYEVFSIDCSQDQTITTKSGSVILIPKHSLTDSSGNIIKGIAEIHYKEYRDQVDIFESGIPMKYDSAGTNYTFESAGMLDIKGVQNDQPLKIAKEKKIDLLFNSTTDASGYNFYNLDEKTKKWNLDSQSIPVFNPNSTRKVSEKKNVNTRVTTITKPKAPIKQNVKKYSLSVAVNSEKNPELDMYNGTIMEVNESEKKFDPIIYNVQWETAELSKSPIKGNYNLLLSRHEDSVELMVYPVVKDEYYNKAVLKYEKELHDYQTKIENKDDFELYDEVPSVLSAEAVTVNKIFGELIAANVIKTSLTSRLIQLTSFGIHNCDRPIVSPAQQPVLATAKEIETDEGQSLDIATYYVSNPKRNAVVTLNTPEEIKYYRIGKTVLWFVDKNGSIGIIPPDQFKNIEDLGHLTCSVFSEEQGIKELRKLLVDR